MPEITVISGKGGTGKTSITAALAHLADHPLICDLDVDAPDLHLILQPKYLAVHEFWSGHRPLIDPGKCTGCAKCTETCQFQAISMNNRQQAVIHPLKCEGCKTCVALCPANAINFVPKQCGHWYLSETRFGPMVHAQLFPAEENSGRLVALLRQQAKSIAKTRGFGLILADGPPGIGCPVISSLSGSDLAVLVTEPTPSGLHDLQRVIGVCKHFKVKMAAMINKCDLSSEISAAIESFCDLEKIPVVARIPHDQAFTQAMIQGQAITETVRGGIADLLQDGWKRITAILKKNRLSRIPDNLINQKYH